MQIYIFRNKSVILHNLFYDVIANRRFNIDKITTKNHSFFSSQKKLNFHKQNGKTLNGKKVFKKYSI